MRSICVVLVIGCGGSQTKRADEWTAPAAKASENVDDWTRADEAKYIRLSCANVVDSDGNFRCESLSKAGLLAEHCVESFNSFRASASSEAHVLAFRMVVNGLSVAQSCDDVDTSFQAGALALQLMDVGKQAGIDVKVHVETCKRRPDGSYDLSGEEALERRGLGDRLFSDTPSAKEAPIEVCGIAAEHEWLMRVTCADGSRPFGRDPDKVRAARSGSIAGHARCDGLALMLDRYEVPCPEKRYDVYMDMYQCGPGESLSRGMKLP